MNKIFSTNRIVSSNEIDQLHHVNNVVYVQWIQDIAELHWKELTKINPLDNYIWMVLRHEVDYLKQAVLGDKITLKTWVGETKGVKSIRHVEILRNEQLLVKAQTTWCLLDANTLRPTRITESVLNTLLPQK